MKKYSVLALSLLLFAYLFVTSAATAGKPGTSVPLKVTVDAMTSGAVPEACKICSDGLGQYVDGVNGVNASFTGNGFLSIAFGLRTVSFDYSYPGNPAPPPAVFPILHPQIISEIPDNRLQDMSFGATQCIGLGWSYDDGGATTRNHGFQFGPNVSGSSHAIVTCTAAANPGNTGPCVQWTVEPKQDGVCNTTPWVAGINDRIKAKGKTTDNNRGAYAMPFKLTLNKK